MAEDAVDKRHSTIGEAVDACMKYVGIPLCYTQCSHVRASARAGCCGGTSCGNSFDSCVDFADLPHLPGALPALMQRCRRGSDNETAGNGERRAQVKIYYQLNFMKSISKPIITQNVAQIRKNWPPNSPHR